MTAWHAKPPTKQSGAGWWNYDLNHVLTITEWRVTHSRMCVPKRQGTAVPFSSVHTWHFTAFIQCASWTVLYCSSHLMSLPGNMTCVWTTINAQSAAINSFPTTTLYITLSNSYYNLYIYNHQMFSTCPYSLLHHRSRNEKNVSFI